MKNLPDYKPEVNQHVSEDELRDAYFAKMIKKHREFEHEGETGPLAYLDSKANDTQWTIQNSFGDIGEACPPVRPTHLAQLNGFYDMLSPALIYDLVQPSALEEHNIKSSDCTNQISENSEYLKNPAYLNWMRKCLTSTLKPHRAIHIMVLRDLFQLGLNATFLFPFKKETGGLWDQHGLRLYCTLYVIHLTYIVEGHFKVCFYLIKTVNAFITILLHLA